MKTRLVVSFVLLAAVSSRTLGNEIYKVDQSRSTIGFTVHQFLGTTHGKFTKVDGKIEIDREHPEKSSVVARIDIRSIDTGIIKRDNHLRSAEFFNVAKFPEMTFKSGRVRQTGQQSGDIFGDLTMHGVTKPITLHVKLMRPISNEIKETRWAVTTVTLKRRAFNMMRSQGAEAHARNGRAVRVASE